MLLLLLLSLAQTTVAMETVEFYVEENTRSGSYIGTLRRPGTISFSVTGEEMKTFSVHGKQGDIRVVLSPDREIKDRYDMTVIVLYDNSDPSAPRAPDAVDVVIYITDVNDNAPIFLRKSVHMTIKESQPVGFKIAIDPAEDPDLGQNSTQTYKIVNDDVPFTLKQTALGFSDQYNCVMVLTRALDREERDSYVVKIVASDGGNPARSDTMVIYVKVADVNDNPPEFSMSIYHPSVSESAPEGTEVCTVLATDQDKGDNAEIVYGLVQRFNQGNLFTIDPESGVISTAGTLDRELLAKHELVVRATDGGEHPQYTTVRVSVTVIDVNDNDPLISVTFLSQQDASGLVSENSKMGNFVAHVTVKDSDMGDNQEVDLSLHGDHIPFVIASVGKGYAIQVSAPLDRESRDTWHVWLTARDHGTPPRVTRQNVTIVVVDVNDCEPVFSQNVYTCNVSEIAAKGTDIVRVSASDPDLGVNSQLTYYIVGVSSVGDDSGINSPISFSINSKTGLISTGSELDREVRESVQLTIEATDNGVPRLSSRCRVVVNIIDYNDNDPRFPQRHYTTLLPEDAPVGTQVLTLTATDIDAGGTGPLKYSLKEFTPRPVFGIKETTGEITTLATLDYETQVSYKMEVSAQDSGGRNGVTYLEVLVRDLNDNAPKFSQDIYKASLLHTVLPGTLVLRVTAFDVDTGDNGKVTYSIVQGSDKFDIDSRTGFISTKVSLSGETNVTEQMTIRARDMGTPTQHSMCSVMVLIGSLSTIDLKPLFLSQEYKVDVPETVMPGHSIATLYAKSQDTVYKGPIKYTLSHLTRQAHDTFEVEETSGRIMLKKQLDREMQDQYNFVVEATDNIGRQGLTAMVVTVTDVNDNAPQFSALRYHFSVSEELQPGSFVAQLEAGDIDYGINGLVQYTLLSSHLSLPFSLNPHTGAISVSHELDYESETEYKVKVKAFNKVTPSLSHVTDVFISILDANDNPPLFIRPSFQFNVLDSSLSDATVGVAMATDRDSGQNGELYYILQPAADSRLFSIDLNSGEIRTGAVFANLILESHYRLRVLCRDRGNPSLNATADVVVEVRSTGDVVDILQQVLRNDVLSRKAKYLIIFFACAFLFSTVVLVCFIRYHRRNKRKYMKLAEKARNFGHGAPPPIALSATTLFKSAENLSLKPDIRHSTETLGSIALAKATSNIYGELGGNYARGSTGTLPSNSVLLPGNNNALYKYLEYGNYCPSIPEKMRDEDLISATYFSDTNNNGDYKTDFSMHKKDSKDSLTKCYPNVTPLANHRTPSRSDVASSYEMSPSAGGLRCGQCQSNESGVHSAGTNNNSEADSGNEHASTPPNSGDTPLCYSEHRQQSKQDNILRSEEKVRSWISSDVHTSDDSLFKPAPGSQKLRPSHSAQSSDSGGESRRQVRFQNLHDSFV